MVVGAGLMCWVISSPTEAGVTLSIKVKEGSSRTVVGAEAEWSCWGFGGMGIFDAESISSCIFFCIALSLLVWSSYLMLIKYLSMIERNQIIR